MFNRREFIKTTAMAGAAVGLYGAFGSELAYAFYQGPGLPKFIQLLRGRDVLSLATEIGVCAPDNNGKPKTFTVNKKSWSVLHYTIKIQQFQDTLHPQFGKHTRLWGYVPTKYLVAGPDTPAHLGGVIVAEKGVPIQITFRNNLPTNAQGWGQIHILPVDKSIPGATAAQNRTAVHLHGGYVPWISDGGPFDWWGPEGNHGASFKNNNALNPAANANEAEYYYPNQQSARLVWYHDHAFGITRVNAYAGIASAFVIRDNFERGLVGLGLPDFIEKGGREIPLVFQDKVFVNKDSIKGLDPTWPGPKDTGSLWYAHTYEPDRWELGPHTKFPPNPSAIPEFFGDTMLVNGTVSPVLHVQPRRYRFRILNACNARFLNLQLYTEDPSNPGTVALDPNNNFNPFPGQAGPTTGLQIGTEGGMLSSPVAINLQTPFDPGTATGGLLMAPAERVDLVVDFKDFANANLILYSDTPSPFPGGDPRNDYFFGNPNNPVGPATAGATPDTRNLLKIVVDQPLTLPADALLGFAAGNDFTTMTLNNEVFNDPLLAPIVAGIPQEPSGVTVRQLTLNEAFDKFGRLIQYLGTNVEPVPGQGFGRAYTDSPTEIVPAGTTEIWEIANLTGDTHPIHFHLVNVQILSRQAFDPDIYHGTPAYTDVARSPDANELGLKETVRMNPGEVTRVIMKFTLPVVPFKVPLSQRDGITNGNEYVWHCHILEHEEHDMMRPLIVV